MKIYLKRSACHALMLALPAIGPRSPAQAAGTPPPFDKSFVTRHTGVFGGRTLRYTATVASTVLTDDSGKPAVNFVTTDYLLDGVTGASRRPVIFAWSGGPSVAAISDHMWILGPKRVLDPGPGHDGGARLVDNADWVLDAADIVLVDPAETGFSRILPGGNRDYFYSVGGDAATIEQFIAIWMKAHHRENAPRFLFGGSYGSVRSIRIAWDLRKTSHPVDGIFMRANCGMLREMNDVVDPATALATQQMTAIYHGKVGRGAMTDAQVIDDAYRFGLREYLPALATVQDLTAERRSALATELSARTGISAAVYLANDLALSEERFMDELLKNEGLVLGAPADGRESRRAGTSAPAPAGDPVPDLFRRYLSDELKVTYPMAEYRQAAPDTGKWNYDGPEGATRADGRNDWPRMLREAMETNRKMLTYSANGYYDLLCTMGQARYMVSTTRLPRDRVEVREYPGPHVLYRVPATALQLTRDLRKMITTRRD